MTFPRENTYFNFIPSILSESENCPNYESTKLQNIIPTYYLNMMLYVIYVTYNMSIGILKLDFT